MDEATDRRGDTAQAIGAQVQDADEGAESTTKSVAYAGEATEHLNEAAEAESAVDRTTQFAEEPVGRLMLRYSGPSIVAMLSSTMFNLINMAFVGRSIGALGIAAIAICAPITMIQGSIGQLIGNGCAAAVSISLGKGERDNAKAILGCSIAATLLVAVVNTILGFSFAEGLLRSFGASEAIMPYARDYFLVYLCGMIFSLGAMNPILRIEGFPKQAMLTMLLMSGLNFIFTPLFLFVFNLGIKGAALGTLCSQFGSSLWILLFMVNKKRVLRLEWKYLRIKMNIISFVLQLGLPSFIMQITQSLLSVVMNRSLGTYGGDIAISAWGITNNINSVVSQPIFGLNQAIQPIVGYNIGAGLYQRVKQTLIYALSVATVFSLVSWLVILLFPEPIIAFFNTDPTLVALGSRMLVVFRMLIFIVGIQQVGATYFQYTGKPNISIFLSLSRQVLILMPCVLILPRFFQFNGILYSGPVSDLLSSALTGGFLWFEVKRLNRLMREEGEKAASA
ncbi:MAG: MATE family efflux transporter [Clostridiales bacterium]|nr:MATE family efflux transporter [Clostridiales bacterium]